MAFTTSLGRYFSTLFFPTRLLGIFKKFSLKMNQTSKEVLRKSEIVRYYNMNAVH